MIVFRAFGVDVSDLVLSVTVPFCVYWLVAAAFDVVSRLKIPWVEQFRIHPKASEKQYNLVRSEWQVCTSSCESAELVLYLMLLLPHTHSIQQRLVRGSLCTQLACAPSMSWPFTGTAGA